METIGFIGLGSQGGPMAQCIADAGMALVVWARRSEVLEPFVANGAKAAASVAELGSRCDHVGICVIDDAGVQAICAELIPAMKPGSRIVIHSTILPETCEALARQAAARGIGLIDAPVSGGGAGATAKTLSVMCGGDEATYEACLPVLRTFAGLVVRLGGVGAGQRAKILNNALLSANMGLAQAAMAVGDALGCERKALAELINASTGRSYGFEIYTRLPSPTAFAHGAALLTKDIALLRAVLPEHSGAQLLAATADTFLDTTKSN